MNVVVVLGVSNVVMSLDLVGFEWFVWVERVIPRSLIVMVLFVGSRGD